MSTQPAPPSLSGRLAIPVAHGQLEAVLKEPEAPVAAAVVCHPHPLGGGTMNNNVVYRLAKALVGA
ncbi:MAG: putative hydrolase of the alpha/beta superfamily protein, partial [Myxococcales bacterium]|nr:putative hydrolase of the alpha/beta superfamily protein [Myxococcales bacterium]